MEKTHKFCAVRTSVRPSVRKSVRPSHPCSENNLKSICDNLFQLPIFVRDSDTGCINQKSKPSLASFFLTIFSFHIFYVRNFDKTLHSLRELQVDVQCTRAITLSILVLHYHPLSPFSKFSA